METTESADTTTVKPSAGRWQFSLREIVLATVAIAAIIAILTQNQPRKISQFSKQFRPSVTLTQIIKDNNLPGRVYNRAGVGEIDRPWMIKKQTVIELNGVPISDFKRVLMPTLMDKVETAIIDDGLVVKASEASGDGDNDTQELKDVSYFSIQYEGSAIKGHLRAISSINYLGDEWLYISLDEH